MSIPDFQALMRPLLEFLSDRKQHSLQEARQALADRFGLTDEERKALLPSGRQAIFVNRVAWAQVYLSQAGLLTNPERGHLKISDRGVKALQESPEKISISYLRKFPEFNLFRSSSKKPKEPQPIQDSEGEGTPEEMLEAAHERLRTDLAK